QAFGCLDHIALDERDGGRPLEQGVEGGDPGSLRRDLRKRVLRHGELRMPTERATQLLELGNGETAVLGQNGGAGPLELTREFGDDAVLVRLRHGSPPSYAAGEGPRKQTSPGVGTGLTCNARDSAS